jgi:hypothetical protein
VDRQVGRRGDEAVRAVVAVDTVEAGVRGQQRCEDEGGRGQRVMRERGLRCLISMWVQVRGQRRRDSERSGGIKRGDKEHTRQHNPSRVDRQIRAVVRCPSTPHHHGRERYRDKS